jgi:hypothetical protein
VQRTVDLFAMSCSGLCAVHCLFTPAALILVPIFGASVMEEDVFHHAILWLILPASLIALTMGCRRHKDRYVALLGLLGLGVIVIAAMLGHGWFGEFGEKALAFAGSLILIAGHYRNFGLCRVAACPE